MNYRISETEDYYPISVLCCECGLEVEPSKEAPDHNLKMWKCEDEDTGELLAAAVAGYRDGCYVLEQLAVKKEYRNEHLGEKMLLTAEDGFRRLGADRIWGCAKVPDYYSQYGWVRISRSIAPDISDCQACRQFHKTCFPCIIMKEL
ncbi:Uncharacterised protein [uncultured Eubacterium sp.]|uniref:GNAT family N-acetyltransferase n=1 Tax=Brotomerdimonas butyrica TaxID=2981721 RepID=UPI0008230F10|nr:GNAT family N-acetyltransferase [Brotomerdimonas butyrica]MCU6755247.1 GNAT family N-acetyltransferase [Brotomerdimonas butyrica]SCH19771.1 Uncharacterised protein [uncultured Eubacterium sp.]